jgi:hypothetical protein
MPNSTRRRAQTSPHDEPFRWTFSQREHAMGLLKAALSEAVVKAVRWSTLRVEEGSFVDPALRSRHSDLVLSARMGAGRVYFVTTHTRLNVEKVSSILAKAVGPQAQEVMVTLRDEIKRRGERRGRARMLLELLAEQFDTVPAEVRARILAADEAMLVTWTARLLSASTLDEVLGEGSERARRPQRASAPGRSDVPPRSSGENHQAGSDVDARPRGPRAQDVIVISLDEIERWGECRGGALTLRELIASRFGAVRAKVNARTRRRSRRGRRGCCRRQRSTT